MNLLLKEYLISGEVSEAEQCLRVLEVPHFHHELVYEVQTPPRNKTRRILEPTTQTSDLTAHLGSAMFYAETLSCVRESKAL